MRTWKTTAILALAALFVVGVSAATAITSATPTPEPIVVHVQEPAQIVDTGTANVQKPMIPELDARPQPRGAVIPELGTPTGTQPAEIEEIEHFLGDGCAACGMG